MFTRYIACLRDHFHLALVTLRHFFPQWLVERSTGTPGHPQRGDGVFLAHALTLESPQEPPIVPGTIVRSSRAAFLVSPQCTADSAIGGPQPGGFFPP